jgi:hypothetical protein
MNETSLRPQGVMTPPDQLSPGTGTPRTIVRCVEMHTFAVDYVTDDGKRHVAIAQRVGGIWHLPPNGENYAATLRPLKKETWLSQLLEERFQSSNPGAQAAANAAIPTGDAVDPLEDEMKEAGK